MDLKRAAGRWLSAITVAGLVTAAGAGGAVAQSEPQVADEVGNLPTVNFGSTELLRAEHALLTRHDDRLEIELRLDTPTPGAYTYPDSVPPERYAAPELFTMWVFVFNRPEHCVSEPPPSRCGGEDFSETVRAGVYNLAAHISSIDHSGGAFELDRGTDGQVVMRGQIMVGEPPRPNSPPTAEYIFGREDPHGAEVHVAIAPHGQVDPATLGTEAFSPAGNPTCGCWWVASFLPSDG